MIQAINQKGNVSKWISVIEIILKNDNNPNFYWFMEFLCFQIYVLMCQSISQSFFLMKLVLVFVRCYGNNNHMFQSNLVYLSSNSN